MSRRTGFQSACGQHTGVCVCLIMSLLLFLAGCSGDRPTDNLTGSPPQNVYHLDDGGFADPPGGVVDTLTPHDGVCVRWGIKAKYSWIRSQAGGGGIYILQLVTAANFPANVNLRLDADPRLNAALSKRSVTLNDPVAEITIRPSENIDTGTYVITVYAYGNLVSHVYTPGMVQRVRLEVEITPWPAGGPDQWILDKRDIMLDWIEETYPGLGPFDNIEWFSYFTYPGILVVEHWTFLSNDWEVRTASHVMIPPHDWSMIWMRPRDEWSPILAAKREHDGTDYVMFEIPVEDYPTFWGY